MKLHIRWSMATVVALTSVLGADQPGWYTEGNFAPSQRLRVVLVNTLSFDRTNCPIVIRREDFPVKKLHEMWVTVVDPSLPSRGKPSPQELSFVGGHGIREETNGHQIFYQLDDLDKDGVWDELFFQTDIKANTSKEMFVYFGFSNRGWNEHGTHATIGSYCRHIIPWWESANIGWKLWFPTSVDMYGKRKPGLMSEQMCINNYCGYNGVPKVNPDWGSDIMGVGGSFGAGGVGLFEFADRTDSISVARFTPREGPKISERNFNEDQITDTRYAYDVVVNGPVRSIIRVRTLNWNSGNGFYELEQMYSAYTNQSYSTCKVTFTAFLPARDGVRFACGIKAHEASSGNFVQGGIAIRSGSEEVADPDDDTGQRSLRVPFVGSALVVKDRYNPEYRMVKGFGGNHTFAVRVNESRTFEYMIAGAWSEGAVYNTPASFRAYVEKSALEYNRPPEIGFGELEER